MMMMMMISVNSDTMQLDEMKRIKHICLCKDEVTLIVGITVQFPELRNFCVVHPTRHKIPVCLQTVVRFQRLSGELRCRKYQIIKQSI